MSYYKEQGREVADRLHATIDYSDYMALINAIDDIDTLEERDRELEDLWSRLEDVPMNPETECIEEPFFELFPAGTDRETIWRWFDARYSRGVAFLLYGDGVDRTSELSTLAIRKCLCEECMSETCAFNPEGICMFPMVYGEKPVVNDDGCLGWLLADYELRRKT